MPLSAFVADKSTSGRAIQRIEDENNQRRYNVLSEKDLTEAASRIEADASPV
jgi:hypothetical protein